MSDLITRLSAELDRREAITRAATPGPWGVNDPNYPEAILGDGVHVLSGGRWGGEASIFHRDEDAHHIAENNPATVLRLIEAHRKIVDEFQYAWERREKSPSRELKAYALRDVVEILAEGYGLTTEEDT